MAIEPREPQKRRTLAARGEVIRLIPSRRNGILGVKAAGEVLLPGADARIAPTTFETWLTEVAALASLLTADESAGRPH